MMCLFVEVLYMCAWCCCFAGVCLCSDVFVLLLLFVCLRVSCCCLLLLRSIW